MQKITQLLLAFFLILGGSFAGTANSFVLPDPSTNSFLYGDFNSYSLPVLAYQHDLVYGGGTGPGNPFYVVSTPGAIKNDIVLGTGASGTPVVTNFPGMDNAYPTPNASSSSSFSTVVTADPANNIGAPYDHPALWDSTLTAFTSYLGGDSPVFFFNNNEENSDAANEQTLLAWGQLILSDRDGVTGADPIYFDFTNTPPGGDAPPSADPSSYWNTLGSGYNGDWLVQDSDYVLSGGQICLGIAASPVPCDGSGGAVVEVINHNLGANQAAYAIISLELNEFLSAWTLGSAYDAYDTISFDFRFKDINNGYEQLFIATADTVVNVPIPEPSTIVLLLTGVFGLFIYQRRKNNS